MPSIYDQPAGDLLFGIPLSARTVLEIGCGNGEFAARYKLLNPNCRYFGIEEDADAAGKAAAVMEQVVTGDPETADYSLGLAEGFDCIVCHTALPHMREPFQAIRRMSEHLAPDGSMSLCVPNIEHWSFVERLLRGTWRYEPAGLLDNGHLRWFGLDSMGRGLADIGMVLTGIRPRAFDVDKAREFVTAMTPALQAMGIEPQSYLQRAAPLQFIWNVRREPVRPMTLSGTQLAPIGGVSHVRMTSPFRAFSTVPGVRASIGNQIDISPPTDDSPRIFVLHRPVLTGEPGRQMLRGLLGAGWLVVTEFDDNPDFFPRMQDEEQLSFRGVHAVQTSTDNLADVLRPRNPELRVFPNGIDSLPEVRNFADPKAMTFFFGALNREQDWRDYMPAINSVAEMAGDRLKFQVIHDETFFNALTSPHKVFIPTCDYATYNAVLNRCDISFMPLSDTGFNRSKSDLKFIEAASHRVAVLASHIVYGESAVDGETASLFRDPTEFRTRLLRLLVMPEIAQAMGDRARAYVAKERMLAYQVRPRLEWYRSLWERREELTAALRARVPDLL